MIPLGRIPLGKITVPLLPPGLVARAGLVEGFDAVDAPGVGLVSAPAGYGKTLSLAAWATDRPHTAWVSLDHHDDARLLWAAILAALTRVAPSSGLHALRPPPAPDDLDFLGRFHEALGALPDQVTLVLDDVHEVDDPAAVDELRSLVRYRPSTLRLVLSSRFDPPLSLSRLRRQGRLWELRADRLAFSRSETDALARRAGLSLEPDRTETLHRQTGGWVAGLALALQAMRTASDPDAFLAAFSGGDRVVADYLVGEVIEALPVRTREFLTLASISDPMPAELAVEITGHPDAVDLLGSIERDTSLVAESPGDDREYRILELLRTYLDAELHRHRPGLAAELHGRAARWWAARDRPSAALEHAVHADDHDLLARLVDRFALHLVVTGTHGPLRRALGACPAERPRQAAAVTRWATLIGDRGDVRDLREALATTIAFGPGDGAAAVAVRRFGRGVDALLSGENGGAVVELDAALDLARRHGFDFLVLQSRILLAVAALLRGDHRVVTELCRTALGEGVQLTTRWERSPWPTVGRILRAHAALLRADPASALETVRDPGHVASPSLRHALRVLGGAATADAGDPAAGLDRIRAARRELDDRPLAPELAAAAAVLEHRTTMLLGLPPDAGLDPPPSVAAFLPETVVEAHLSRAAAAARDGGAAAARLEVGAALAVAEPIDLLRPFAQAAPEVVELLGAEPPGEFVARVLAVRPSAGPGPGARLTRSELGVLALLPSLMSSDEIAAALGVSRSTIKTHSQVIYAKLSVQSRRAAVHVARERGLLPAQEGGSASVDVIG